MGGQVISLNLVEELGKAVLCRLIYIYSFSRSSVEVLAEAIRRKKGITGIKRNGTLFKLSQFAASICIFFLFL